MSTKEDRPCMGEIYDLPEKVRLMENILTDYFKSMANLKTLYAQQEEWIMELNNTIMRMQNYFTEQNKQ